MPARNRTPARRPTTMKPPLRLGAVAGATPGKWIDRWTERVADQRLELIALTPAEQRQALDDQRVDAALLRRPFETDDLHVIDLYHEQAVVLMGIESSLSVADDLHTADLAGETLFTSADSPHRHMAIPETQPSTYGTLETLETLVDTVATGAGVAIVPQSIARAHTRRDLTWRPLSDVEPSTMSLAWRRDRDADDIQLFVGIVRGRRASSSR